jgi:hypothetical protein
MARWLAGLLAVLLAGAPQQKSEPPQTKADKSDPAARVWKADDVKVLTGLEGKEVTVRGKVVKVYVPDSQRSVILNFGRDPKTCFKAVVFARSFEKFGGPDGLRKYEGKEVTVEGKVTLFEKLPQVVLNVPAQIREAK